MSELVLIVIGMTVQELKKTFVTRFFAGAAGSFLVLGLAFQYVWLGFLVIPGITGMWWVFQQWKEKDFARKVWQASLLFFGLVWSWLLQIDPAGWSPLKGLQATMFIIFVWLIVILLSSIPLYWAARLWKIMHVKNQKLNWVKKLALFISLWILQEIGRSYLFALIMLGDSTTVSPHWNFGTLGIALTSIPTTLPLASTVGMYGLSTVAIVAGVSLYYGLQKNRRGAVLATGLFALHIIGYGLARAYTNNSDTKISVTALNAASGTIEYNAYASPGNPADLMILPEYSDIFSDALEDDVAAKRDVFLDNTAQDQTVIISSIDEQLIDGAANRLTAYDRQGSVLDQQDKTFIIPGGEYLPYWFEGLYARTQPSGLQQYNFSRKVRAGSTPEKPIETQFGSIGSYACSGVISPQLYRNMAAQGAQVLTNSASLTIFEGSESYHQQTEGFAVFHAAANKKPFIQSTKSGKAYIIHANGTILQSATTGENKLLSDTITLSNSKTFYTRAGEVTVYAALLYCVWLYTRKSVK